MERFGTDRGGMLVSVGGVDRNGTVLRRSWAVVADEGHGPEIPCMAALLVVRKLARNAIASRGAFPCMGFLALQEFTPEFERWNMKTGVREEVQ
jgi:hypothetical protein